MKGKPNIIFIMCDQLRAFETGCYGNTVIHTPNIDSLADEGFLFETAVTNYPVCMAARSVALSGQYNRQATGGVGNVGGWMDNGGLYMPQYPQAGRPHLKNSTLAENLRDMGYDTAVIGKWHIHSWPDDIGFDEYLIPRVHHCHTGQHFTHNGGPEFVAPGFSVDYECDQVDAYLEAHARQENPFFLFYSISPPHCPISDAPDHYLNMYDPASIPLRPNVDLSVRVPDQDHWFNVYRWDFRYYNFHLPYTENLPAEYTLRKVIAEYYGLTTWVDDMVGRVMNSLEKLHIAEDTIVVFTSDHGDYLGSHNRVQKGDLHEESIRIPLIFRWVGGLAHGRNTAQVASLVDVFPTLLGLVGAEVPEHVHGEDLSALVRQENDEGLRQHAIIEKGDGVGIRTPELLYGINFNEGTTTLNETPAYSYDMVNDPYQLENRYEAGLDREMLVEADRQLREWDAATPFRGSET